MAEQSKEAANEEKMKQEALALAELLYDIYVKERSKKKRVRE